MIVGIAVGVVAAIALIAGVAGWMLYRRRRSYARQPAKVLHYAV